MSRPSIAASRFSRIAPTPVWPRSNGKQGKTSLEASANTRAKAVKRDFVALQRTKPIAMIDGQNPTKPFEHVAQVRKESRHDLMSEEWVRQFQYGNHFRFINLRIG